MAPFFILNNISSKDYLTIDKLPPIVRAAKDIEKIEIPGRDGFLTNDLGSYKSTIKSVECWIKNLDDIDFICSWLTGSADVIFSNEPEKVYKATIINQINFSKILREFHRFLIQFECQPHKYSIGNRIITLEAPGTIFNSGCVISRPIIKLFGTGNVNLSINGNVVNLTNIVDYVTINSDLMDCYKDTQLKNNDMSGEFPNLEVGNNTISWSGTLTKIDVTPNWRWI
jgi:predicted phage tail component-like protein